MSASALELRGLSKRFGRTLAVDGLNLDVPTGSFVCLVGPSGCGKTTALRLIAGLESPSEGAILSEGVDITRRHPAERGLGMVFQSYALFPNLTVGANVSFGLPGAMPTAQKQARVAELLELVGLAAFAQRRPADLSGGQQQRVALARALAPGPRILLLDEPLSALDPHLRDQLRAELKALQARLGITTIMVTHDQAEALALADQIAVMRGGRLEQVGSPEAIYGAPANAFVASFIGPLNQLPATVGEAGQVVLANGARIAADISGLAKGAAVIATIRPDAVRIAGASDAGALSGQVIAREFAGASVRLSIRLGDEGGPVLRLDVGADHPRASAGLGEVVDVALPADQVRLFAAEPRA
ncbi:MAG: ABC transporter ATP-binding protein [Caulobacteraceae bacterium]|nr:ABC transporter ATP-binding protein [Caulobacteraceae bacterium]